jgi:cell division protein FtsB
MKISIVYVAVLALMAFYLVFGHNGILKYAEMREIQKEYEEQIRIMNDRITYLHRELELIKQSELYIEYVIRRELGLQKPDEHQYILPENATIPR